MIQSILDFHAWSSKRRRSKNRFKRNIFKIINPISEAMLKHLLPLVLKCTRGKNSLETRVEDANNPRIIVSLTSFPARINVVWIVVEMMLRQTVKPDLVVLYLSNKQFDSIDSLPMNLQKIMGRGLEVRFIDVDLRSHNKYHYAMKDYPNDNIITIDDDIYYNNQLIEELFDAHSQTPKSVISVRARTIGYDNNMKLLPYSEWYINSNKNGYINLQTGVDGVLYPPPHVGENATMYKDLLNSDLAMRLAPAADDLWLFAMTRLAGTKVVKSSRYLKVIDIPINNNVRLCDTNCGENRNDVQTEQIRKYYIETIGVDPFEYKE